MLTLQWHVSINFVHTSMNIRKITNINLGIFSIKNELFIITVMFLKFWDRHAWANSVDPDQPAPKEQSD